MIKTQGTPSSFGLVYKSSYPYRTLHHCSCRSFGKANSWNRSVVAVEKLNDYDAEMADQCSRCLPKHRDELAQARNEARAAAEAAKVALEQLDRVDASFAPKVENLESTLAQLRERMALSSTMTKTQAASLLESIAEATQALALQIRNS